MDKEQQEGIDKETRWTQMRRAVVSCPQSFGMRNYRERAREQVKSSYCDD